MDKRIQTISPRFHRIYSDSLHAEILGLDQIVGGGFRKALEFLIKYFCIHLYPDQKVTISKTQLSNVIKNHINHNRVRALADRAAWLGNDELHYTRKWKNKDVEGLTNLLDLTRHHIAVELEDEEYIDDMPKKPKETVET